MRTTAARVAMALVGLLVAGALCWRPLAALWLDNLGSIAYAKGDLGRARALFDRGLEFEPRSPALLEDRGRAELDADPAAALRDLAAADCGAACLAEAGDAQVRLGDSAAAVDDYLRAKAVTRLETHVAGLADAGQYEEAIALERALAGRLSSSPLDRGNLARTLWQIGRLEIVAAYRQPARAAAERADAFKRFRRASELAPYNESYLLSLGYAELNWGDKRIARRAFARLLELYPHQPDAERALARLAPERATPAPAQ